ncbi:SCO family protein [Xanthocytophaga agilis]|uniref:SCO family protein n=1 Tax=Xanthocytophaga agilis TaxID=3048010 RepID=A0AAE3RCX8_9BACT|nr:SCO family protein [Xanthocytophaga agilis]MDJ1506169.1 SCO family protein [Xanthocytophaga agilis]
MKTTNLFYTLFILCVVSLMGCNQEKGLPILGPTHEENGKTVYHTIPAFSYRDQDSTLITNETLKGKIYIADFFYSYCPTICPKVKKESMRVYEKFKDNPDVIFVSITLDPKHDNVSFLKEYAENFGLDSKKWHFLTGDKAATYQLAQKGLMVTALEDKSEPGGIVHSGALVLIDRQGRIRGFYDGTVPSDVTNLLYDIPTLLKEKE